MVIAIVLLDLTARSGLYNIGEALVQMLMFLPMPYYYKGMVWQKKMGPTISIGRLLSPYY
jgi:hypothetical protein